MRSSSCAWLVAVALAAASPAVTSAPALAATTTQRPQLPPGVRPAPARLHLAPPEPRRPLPRTGRRPASEIQWRASMGDRVLAELIAERWGELPPGMAAAERMTRILGEPLAQDRMHALRAANRDLLGRLPKARPAHAGPDATYTPELLGRIGAVIARNPGASATALAAQLGRDPELRQVVRFTADVVHYLFRRYGDALPRSRTAQVEATPERWQQARRLLVEHPTETLAEIAGRLGGEQPAGSGQGAPTEATLRYWIRKFDSVEAIGRARERATAERLAHALGELPEGSSLAAVVRAVRDELPHLQEAGLLRLRAGHPELLGRLTVRETAPPLSAEARTRLRRLALEHPSLSLAQLAGRLRGDPLLGPLRTWTADGLGELAGAQGPLPGQEERRHALAQQAAALWSRLPGGTTIDQAVEVIAAEHPGFDGRLLRSLVPLEPRLAREVARTAVDRAPASARPAPVPELEVGKGRRLDLSRQQLARALAQPRSPLIGRLLDELRQLERTVGDNDGQLAPRDLTSASPLVARVLERMYARTGRRTLSLDEIGVELPPAVAFVARQALVRRDAAGMGLYDEAAREAVDELRASYRAEVLQGRRTATDFSRGRGWGPDRWARLRRLLPDVFVPPDGGPADERLEALSGLYVELGRGALDLNTFYRRAHLRPEELVALQVAQPERFPPLAPPAGDAPRGSPTEALASTAGAGRGGERGAGGEAAARAIGARGREIFAADVLGSKAAMLAALNADRDLVAAIGPITLSRYDTLMRRFPDHFPRLDDRGTVEAALAGELRALLAQRPGLRPHELAAEMRTRHPRFRRSRLAALRQRYPDLLPAAPPSRAPGGSAAAEADRTATGRRHDHHARSSRAIAELLGLAIRVAPPGTSEAAIDDVVNALIVERGLEPFGSRITQIPGFHRPGGAPRLEEHSARVAAEVVAEYARAAPRGEPEAAILARVERDYPTLSPERLGRYRRRWRERPDEHAALRPFRGRDGGVELRGLGRPPARPRYLGGWDVERALLGHPETRRELARGAQYARIPMRLPLLDRMVRDLGGRRPLEEMNVLWVSHLLGTTFPLAGALRASGLSVRRTIVVGSPYGTNEAVKEALSDEGFDVRVPPLEDAAYRREVARALSEVAARHRQNGRPVLVLDDGGLVAELLHRDAGYADVLGAVRIVEQTTRGVDAAERTPPGVPVISVARSRSKQREGAFIGRAVAAKLEQALSRVGRRVEGTQAVVIGYGVVGAALAAELRRGGARVTVVETSTERTSQARRAGFAVGSREEALAGADLVLGATGRRSITLEDLRHLRSGTVVASASSRRVEIDMEALAREANAREEVGTGELVRLPSARYRLGRRELLVLGDGWPVNFDGDVEDVPAEQIQLTRAVMLAGALQAASLRGHFKATRRLVPLDPAVDGRLLEWHQSETRGRRAEAVGDPERWPELVREVAARLRPAASRPPPPPREQAPGGRSG